MLRPRLQQGGGIGQREGTLHSKKLIDKASKRVSRERQGLLSSAPCESRWGL